jgi:hypothetical protein
MGGQMEQVSLSQVQYAKSKGHDKSKVKSQLNVEVEVQEMMDLFASQLCLFKQHLT